MCVSVCVSCRFEEARTERPSLDSSAPWCLHWPQDITLLHGAFTDHRTLHCSMVPSLTTGHHSAPWCLHWPQDITMLHDAFTDHRTLHYSMVPSLTTGHHSAPWCLHWRQDITVLHDAFTDHRTLHYSMVPSLTTEHYTAPWYLHWPQDINILNISNIQFLQTRNMFLIDEKTFWQPSDLLCFKYRKQWKSHSQDNVGI